MYTILIAASIAGVAIGIAGAYAQANPSLTRRLHFVERENLDSELDRFDIDVDASESCMECGDEIDPSEIAAVVNIEGEYRFVGKHPDCLDTYDVMTP
ncbi:MAG: hypothetical protein U5K37_08535 [Natrialbaceae archaeon]|nr:hypothetical protein [Natrialbaceae archaeon]